MSLRSLLALDERLTDRLRLDPGRGKGWKLAAFFAHSGDSWFWMLGLVAIWLLADDAWHYRAGYMGLCVGGLALLVFAIKFTIKRERPQGEWGQIYRRTDPHSFPSGHAARAVMLAALAVGLGPSWLAIVLLLWAPLVCLARIVTGMHYVSDVLAGAALGLAAGWLLVLMQPLVQALLPFVLYR